MTAARVCLALFFGLTARPLAAQRTVMVHEEPRHRILWNAESLRVLDVQIQPADTTLFHTHDVPITYVTIGRSSTDQQRIGSRWGGTEPTDAPPGREGDVRAVLDYANEPLTHRVANVGTTLFRLIAITNEGHSSGHGDGPEPLPGSQEGESDWFRYSRVTLQPGVDVFGRAMAPTVVVMVRDGRLAIHHPDEWVTSLEHSGDVRVLETGSEYRLANHGDNAVEAVLVEVR